MFYWSESFTSLVRFWQPQFDGLTRLTLTPLDFTTDLRHWRRPRRQLSLWPEYVLFFSVASRWAR